MHSEMFVHLSTRNKSKHADYTVSIILTILIVKNVHYLFNMQDLCSKARKIKNGICISGQTLRPSRLAFGKYPI
jgi:hypothetical protein